MNGRVLLKAEDLNIWTPTDVCLSLFLSLVSSVALTRYIRNITQECTTKDLYILICG